ncbi:hypothetical protein Nepgr_014597, partial [Nepenthes gracilis]
RVRNYSVPSFRSKNDKPICDLIANFDSSSCSLPQSLFSESGLVVKGFQSVQLFIVSISDP